MEKDKDKLFSTSPYVMNLSEKESTKNDYIKLSKDTYYSFNFGCYWRFEHKLTKKAVSALIINKDSVDQSMKAAFEESLQFSYSYEHPYFQKLYTHFEEQNHIVLIFSEGCPYFSMDNRFNKEFGSCVALFQLINATRFLLTKKIFNHNFLIPEYILYSSNSKTIKVANSLFLKIFAPPNFKKNFLYLNFEAPERLKNKNLDFNEAAAVWALGIHLYNSLSGFFPYKGNNYSELESNLKGSDSKIIFSEKFSNSCRNLIEIMLKKNPQHRIDLNGVINHQYFKDILKQENVKRFKDHSDQYLFDCKYKHESLNPIVNKKKSMVNEDLENIQGQVRSTPANINEIKPQIKSILKKTDFGELDKSEDDSSVMLFKGKVTNLNISKSDTSAIDSSGITSKVPQSLIDEKQILKKDLEIVKEKYNMAKLKIEELSKTNEESKITMRDLQSKVDRLLMENEILSKNHSLRLKEIEEISQQHLEQVSQMRILQNSMYLEMLKNKELTEKNANLELKMKEQISRDSEDIFKKEKEIKQLQEKLSILSKLETNEIENVSDKSVVLLIEYIKEFKSLLNSVVSKSVGMGEKIIDQLNLAFANEHVSLKSIFDNIKSGFSVETPGHCLRAEYQESMKAELMEYVNLKISEGMRPIGTEDKLINSLKSQIEQNERIIHTRKADIYSLNVLIMQLRTKEEKLLSNQAILEGKISDLKDFIYKNVAQEQFEEFMVSFNK